MKLLIGLGNPGEKYKNNRHNVGHLFVDRVRSPEFVVKKSDAFMNNSGQFVKKLLDYYQLPTTDLYIVHDDLDIPLGQFKIQKGVGPKVHNGVNNVEEVLGTKDFWRIRVGIDNRGDSGQARMTGEKYVLQDFTKEELEILKRVQDDIYAELKKRFSQG